MDEDRIERPFDYIDENPRVEVTLNDGDSTSGEIVTFDKHLNLILDRDDGGLVLYRGASIVSIERLDS